MADNNYFEGLDYDRPIPTGMDGGVNVTGGGVNVTGGGMNVTGGGVTITGSDPTISGSDPTISGSDPTITGGDPTVSDGGVNITGNGVNVTGNGIEVTPIGPGVTTPTGIPNPFINIINAISFNLFDHLLVTPDMLLAKAEAVLAMINAMQKNFEELEAKINGTANYWQGEASEVHREKYQNKKADIEEAFKRLLSDTENLRKMAAVYTATENAAIDISTDLPGDVIV